MSWFQSVYADEVLRFDLAVRSADLRDNLAVYLHNPGSEPFSLKSVYVDGADIAALAEKGQKIHYAKRQAGIVRWYDLIPNPIPPGGWAVLRVRFGTVGVLGERVKVRLIGKSGKQASATLNLVTHPPVEFDSFSFGQRLKTLSLYVRLNVLATLTKVFIQGEDFTKWTTLKEIEIDELRDARLNLLEISPPNRFREHSYVVVKVATSRGANACLLRVERDYFPIGIFGVQRYIPGTPDFANPAKPDDMRECAEHLIDVVAPGYHVVNPDLSYLKRYGLDVIGGRWAQPKSRANKRLALHPALRGWWIADEPHLANVSPMELIRRREAFRGLDPRAPSWLNHCPSLGAYYDYDVADIISLDYYPIPQGTLQVIEHELDALRRAVAPKPVWFVPQAFRSNNSSRWPRFPTRDEERLMVSMALAHGAKGIIYFSYGGNVTEPVHGVGLTNEPEAKALWSAIRRLNMELAMLGPLLVRGVPTRLAQATHKNVEAVAIVCGEEAIVLFVINHDYKCALQVSECQLRPARGISVTVKVPKWFKVSDVFEVRYGGPKGIKCRIAGHIVSFRLSEVRTARAFVIAGRRELRLKLWNRLRVLPCMHVMRTPVIDGALDDWQGIVPIELPQMAACFQGLTGKPDDLSAKVRVAWDERFFYFCADVRDDRHCNEKTGSAIWDGDCVQIAFDTLNNAKGSGYDNDDYEYGFALTRRGIERYRWVCPPGMQVGANSRVRLFIRREGQRTIYEAAIPASEIEPLRLNENTVFRLNFVFMDDDTGYGQSKFMGLTRGITYGKAPALFRKFVLLR